MFTWAQLRARKLPLLTFLLIALGAGVAGLVGQDSTAGRDSWQRPQEVMDALGIAPGSVVADVGCGRGYFTFHLARRVTGAGRVYAVDIDADDLRSVRRRAEREQLSQIETILGEVDDPRLPANTLDAVLIVDAYHEMRKYTAMLAAIYRALKPGAQLGIIDGAIEAGEKRSTYYRRHRIPEGLVREDAARTGFRFLGSRPGFVRPRGNKEFYFLIFEKPQP